MPGYNRNSGHGPTPHPPGNSGFTTVATSKLTIILAKMTLWVQIPGIHPPVVYHLIKKHFTLLELWP